MTKTKQETYMEYHLKENIVFKSLIKRSINQKRERSNSTFCTLNVEGPWINPQRVQIKLQVAQPNSG
jgi:hypothetical protein